jgi:hypothetical protein
MAKNRIFTVGFVLPGDEFEYIEFNSDQTLLDADIILFEPTLRGFTADADYCGKPLLSEHDSFTVKERLGHWRSEIASAANAGKVVVVFLTKPIECYRYTGSKQFSGTGRSRVATNLVEGISSYEAVPNVTVTPKSGKEIRIEKDARFIAPYWTEFSKYSPYEVEIVGDLKHILLRSRVGDRIVGGAIYTQGGVLLFLPSVRFDPKKFVRHNKKTANDYWTDEALKFGKRLVAALVAMADSRKQSTLATPAPTWTLETKFRLAEEGALELAISACTAEIAERQAKKTALGVQLDQAGNLRRLLFEQGRPLEHAVLEALRLIGFESKPLADGDSEFDAVFVSAEGRGLGEVEGKDNKPINIDKFSQLERNLQEDFARGDVTDYAKGVLFGNAYRLVSPAERGAFFTEKCVAAAKRVRAALVRTPDLFAPARYLKENPSAVEYAKKCREAIFCDEGDVVVFPAPPTGESTATAEIAPVPKAEKPGC